MKISSILIPLASFAVAAGCKSPEPRQASLATPAPQTITQTAAAEPAASVSSVPSQPKPLSVQEVKTDKATYTIEVLPNTRLTPTSREGDQTNRVYSSNIIAVYVRTNGGVTVNSSDASAVPTPANHPQLPNE